MRPTSVCTRSHFTLALLLAVCALAAAASESAVVFRETFNSDDWQTRWTVTHNEKFTGQWTVAAPDTAAVSGERSLTVPAPARHYAIFAPFARPLLVDGRELVLQYEVRAQNGWSCAGGYIKLVQSTSAGDDGGAFTNDSPYTIMFGPDKCGASRVHFIFRHQNPLTQAWEEKHMNNPPAVPSDTKTHLYTLHVGPGTRFRVLIDKQVVRDGDLLQDFEPAVNPPATIDDPEDIKPADWIDDPQMSDPDDRKPDDWDESQPQFLPDPDAVKPADWLDDEPLYVPDPEAVKPDDWTDADGDWEPPLIYNPKCEEHGCGEWTPADVPNPNFRGKWHPRRIDNPDYKGPWKARQLPNPNYFEDREPNKFAPISGVGIEIWTMDSGLIFDDIFIGHDFEAAQQFAQETFDPKAALEAEVLKDPEPIADGPSWLELLLFALQENLWLVSIGAVAVAIPFVYLLYAIASSAPKPAAAKANKPAAAGAEGEEAKAKEPAAANKTKVD